MFTMAIRKLLRNRRFQKLFSRRIRDRLDPRERREVVIDVAGACNLRCPSCPVGSIGYDGKTPGLMDPALFARLIDKANEEFRVKGVNLFNWGELMLHPQLPALIRIVKERGLRCILSSNLNLLRDPDAVVGARPDALRVSLSGFSQAIYRQTHARGDIERVKRNMRELSAALGRVDPPLPLRRGRDPVVEVYFHKYRHNLHEVEPMRALATELGFSFKPVWAYYMPLEKALALVEGELPAEERAFVERQFALPIAEAIDSAREYRSDPCGLLEGQIVLDLEGNLVPCCTIYDMQAHTLGSYLDLSVADQRSAKRDLAVCQRCTAHGLHKYFTYSRDARLAQRYEELVARNLARRGPLAPAAAPPASETAPPASETALPASETALPASGAPPPA